MIGRRIGAGGRGGNPSGENAGSILFSQKSIFDNITLALSANPSTVPFHRVVEAYRVAMFSSSSSSQEPRIVSYPSGRSITNSFVYS
jgi:hypothetical protein